MTNGSNADVERAAAAVLSLMLVSTGVGVVADGTVTDRDLAVGVDSPTLDLGYRLYTGDTSVPYVGNTTEEVLGAGTMASGTAGTLYYGTSAASLATLGGVPAGIMTGIVGGAAVGAGALAY
jgi:hypothetical protein